MSKTLRKVSFEQIDTYRHALAAQYIDRHHYLSPEAKAINLLTHARKKGLCNWKYIGPTFLQELAEERPVSKWMLLAMFDLLFKRNWQPETDELWALLIKTWMHEYGPFVHVGEVLDALPEHINKLSALEWVIFMEERLPMSKRTHVLWRIEDKHGRKVQHDCISQSLALETLAQRYPEVTLQNLAEYGFSIGKYYELIETILVCEEIPENQRAIVKKKGQA